MRGRITFKVTVGSGRRLPYQSVIAIPRVCMISTNRAERTDDANVTTIKGLSPGHKLYLI